MMSRLPLTNLRRHIAANRALPFVVLVAVGMAAIDHDARLQAGFLQLCGHLRNRRGVIVHRFSSSAQDHMAVGIARGDEDGGLPALGMAEKCMRMRRRQHGLDGDLHVA